MSKLNESPPHGVTRRRITHAERLSFIICAIIRGEHRHLLTSSLTESSQSLCENASLPQTTQITASGSI